MKRSRSVALGLTVLFLASPGVASADCQKVGSRICGSGAPRISSDAGLQVSRGGDFAPFAGGALRGGDKVLTSAGATLDLGPSCHTPVGAGSLVSIGRSGGRSCASVTEQTAQAGDIVQAEAGVDPALVGLGLGGAAALGIGLALSGGNGGGGTVSAR